MLNFTVEITTVSGAVSLKHHLGYEHNYDADIALGRVCSALRCEGGPVVELSDDHSLFCILSKDIVAVRLINNTTLADDDARPKDPASANKAPRAEDRCKHGAVHCNQCGW